MNKKNQEQTVAMEMRSSTAGGPPHLPYIPTLTLTSFVPAKHSKMKVSTPYYRCEQAFPD
jgi:hypothetical protein